MFKEPPLSVSIILEIIRLGNSSFFPKCSKFNAHFRNAIKNLEKIFYFQINGASSCYVKFSMFRREYLSSVVNVLTNSVKILDQTKADFAQVNLPQIHEKIS